jgi:murein DD-endopeptidase MepM/ murein hydrolase activator NlpD
MRRLIAAAALGLALVGCARKAPPAPVIQGRLVEAVTDRPESVVVAPGETLYGIARRWQVPVRTLIEENNLQPPYGLLAGTRLKLPQLRVHTVQPGETLYGVARRFGVDVASLGRANRLEPPYAIRSGEMLVLPEPPAVAAAPKPQPERAPLGAAPAPPPAAATAPPPAAPAAPPSAAAAPSAPPSLAGASTVSPAPPELSAAPQASPAVVEPPPPMVEAPPPPEPPAPAPPAGRGFIWPVKGRILSGFGPGPGGTHNDGINIAAAAGTPVRAVEDGVVAYVGNELRGFGNLVLLKHPNGWMSAYAHCEATLVKKGARVRRGDTIARVGATGAVGEPQLHFELRRGTRAIDPAQQLPAGAAT